MLMRMQVTGSSGTNGQMKPERDTTAREKIPFRVMNLDALQKNQNHD